MHRNYTPTPDLSFYQQSYQDDGYGQGVAGSCEYYSNTNASYGPGAVGGMDLNPTVPYSMNGWSTGQALWDSMPPSAGNMENLPSVPNTPRAAGNQANGGGYDKDNGQQQHFPPPPPGYQQMAPLTPNYVQSQGVPTGQVGAQSPPAMAPQPMYQQGYHPQMPPPGMMPAMYMPVGAYQGSPGVRYHDQQQYAAAQGMYPQQYYFPHPNMPPPPMMFYQYPPMPYQMRKPYRNTGRGGYSGPTGRNYRNNVQTEMRPESVRSDQQAEEALDEAVDNLNDLQIGDAGFKQIPIGDSKGVQRPTKQMLQLANGSDSKLDLASQSVEASVVSEKKVACDEKIKPSEPVPSKGDKCCYYCKTKGKPVEEYSNHTLKDDKQVVICPDAVKNMECTNCGKKGGGDAHSQASCPIKSSRNFVPRDRRPINQEQRYPSGNYHRGYGQRDGNYQHKKQDYHRPYRGHRGGYNMGNGSTRGYRGSSAHPSQQQQTAED